MDILIEVLPLRDSKYRLSLYKCRKYISDIIRYFGVRWSVLQKEYKEIAREIVNETNYGNQQNN